MLINIRNINKENTQKKEILKLSKSYEKPINKWAKS